MGKDKLEVRVANQFYGGNLTEAQRAIKEIAQESGEKHTSAQLFQRISYKRGKPKGETHWKRFGDPETLDK